MTKHVVFGVKNTHLVNELRFPRRSNGLRAWTEVEVTTPCQKGWREVPAEQLKSVKDDYPVSCPICREADPGGDGDPFGGHHGRFE